MAILGITTEVAGQVGDIPRIVRINCNDSYATITAAGYLNGAAVQGYTFYPSDTFLISYGTNPASPSIDFFNATTSNGVISLVAGSGSVALPTIANHLAVFSDTTGGLTQDPATAISGGNLQAGLSGTAGTLGSFPSTAASGELLVAAVNNSAGNFNTTISNASSVAQNQTISIPDGGNAASNFIISNSAGTQSIATGNLTLTAGSLQAGSSGNAGNLKSFPASATSGSLALTAVANSGNFANVLSNASTGQATTWSFLDPAAATANIGTFVLSVTMNQAAVQGAFATPFQLLATPGAGKVIMVSNAVIYTNFQTAAFAGGGVAVVQYGNSVHGAGTNALAATIPAAEITAAASQIYMLNGSTGNVLTAITNQGIFFSNQTGAFTNGNAASTVVITLTYQVISATV